MIVAGVTKRFFVLEWGCWWVNYSWNYGFFLSSSNSYNHNRIKAI